MFGKMKLDPADTEFSKAIRYRDDWTCQRCQTKYRIGSKSLQASHYFGRRMETVRFDPDNVDALCFGCHRYWEKEDREGYRDFKLKQLGKASYNALRARAYQLGKKDRKWALIMSKEYHKKMKQEYDERHR